MCSQVGRKPHVRQMRVGKSQTALADGAIPRVPFSSRPPWPGANRSSRASLALLANLAYHTIMDSDAIELSVTEARNRFSDAVNRAAFGGEVTYVTRGRGNQRAAAIVPAELVERYEAMLDAEDGRIAQQRLDDLAAGRRDTLPADEVERALRA